MRELDMHKNQGRWISLIVVGLCFSVFQLQAQYEDSPMKGISWWEGSAGFNNSDYQSWNATLGAHQRGESALISQRISFSQEFKSSPNDSILSIKNRQLETALMIGEAWKGKKKNWWVATGVGMSLNLRMFANFKPQSETEIQYLTKFTMGAAGHAEMGWMLNQQWGAMLNFYGNWNFRQPYFGTNVGLVYRPKSQIKKSE